MAQRKKQLGELLVSWGVVAPESVDSALQHAAENGKRIGGSLVELEMCSEEDVAKLCEEFYAPERQAIVRLGPEESA